MRVGITLWGYKVEWLQGRQARIALQEFAEGRDMWVTSVISHRWVFRTMVF